MPYRIGVDVGGTFTDFLVVDDRGETQTHKAPTTPHDLTKAFLTACNRSAATGDSHSRTFCAR